MARRALGHGETACFQAGRPPSRTPTLGSPKTRIIHQTARGAVQPASVVEDRALILADAERVRRVGRSHWDSATCGAGSFRGRRPRRCRRRPRPGCAPPRSRRARRPYQARNHVASKMRSPRPRGVDRATPGSRESGRSARACACSCLAEEPTHSTAATGEKPDLQSPGIMANRQDCCRSGSGRVLCSRDNHVTNSRPGVLHAHSTLRGPRARPAPRSRGARGADPPEGSLSHAGRAQRHDDRLGVGRLHERHGALRPERGLRAGERGEPGGQAPRGLLTNLREGPPTTTPSSRAGSSAPRPTRSRRRTGATSPSASC